MLAKSLRQLRIADVMIAAVSLCLLASLIAPSVAGSNNDARRAKCLNNIKQIGLALQNHESSRKYFPLASTGAITAKPGSAGKLGEGAGFSWLAQLLPHFNEVSLYNAMRENSNKMTESPFANPSDADGGRSIASASVDVFICPGFEGRRFVDVTTSDYTADGPAGHAPAIANYFALSATHMIRRDDGWFIDERPESVLQGNGAIPMVSAEALKNGWKRVRGATHAAIARDGSTYTFMFAEGREQAYAAWIDGQVAWTVAAWPRNAQPPTLQPLEGPNRSVLGWNDDAGDDVGVCIAKQPLGAGAELTGAYLPAGRWSGSKERKYGPSGNHPGVTGHGFGDAHAAFVANDIDRNVYLHLTTRNGGEAIFDSTEKFISVE